MAAKTAFILGALCLGAAAPGRAANVTRLEGLAEVFLPAAERWQRIGEPPYGLRSTDRVRVRPASVLRIEFEDGSWLEASNQAQFQLESESEERRVLRLDAGTLELGVRRVGQRITEVRTPAANVHLREDRVVFTADQRKATFLRVIEGLARVSPATGEPLELQKGYVLYILKDKEPGLPLRAEAYAELERQGIIWPGQPVRAQKRPRDRSVPTLDPKSVERPPPQLGASSLGLPPPPKPAPPPKRPGQDVPLEALDPGPELGVQSLGLRVEEKAAPKGAPRKSGPRARKGPEDDLAPLIGP